MLYRSVHAKVTQKYYLNVLPVSGKNMLAQRGELGFPLFYFYPAFKNEAVSNKSSLSLSFTLCLHLEFSLIPSNSLSTKHLYSFASDFLEKIYHKDVM